MLATIAKCETGTCVWCKSHGEGVQVRFEDGLSGFFCRKDFWTALKVRSETKEEADVAETPATGRTS